ncbi:hypothetical protein HYS10_01805, partial [Candidatus Collierbacteria bacterium]|nr:hypothetical protein [Candidatus Collierbacteria bacterium]
GILHWGLYPELDGKPWPSEDQMLQEIKDLQALGFNLIKFCLWVPPERYYQLCQEMGMFVWQEYPVWNKPIRDRSILSEYEELFRHDGPYSCVILRTLTCENDQTDPQIIQEIIDMGHRLIPGSLILDNGSWVGEQRPGDFHDEHPYLHNAQWIYYAERMNKLNLQKPLLLGETMAVDTAPQGPHTMGAKVRQHQIETLARDLPGTGYVLTAIRDLGTAPFGLYTYDGKLKYSPEEWAWHQEKLALPERTIPEADLTKGAIIGPRKGQWKCPESRWWSPVMKVLDAGLPEAMIQEECIFDLLSGRVLTHTDGTNVLVEMWDYHSGKLIKHPLVIEFTTNGERHFVSAFRHDTPSGQELWNILQKRSSPAPEIGPLIGDAIVLEDWEMSQDKKLWLPVKCDTPLVNHGRNVYLGLATFRTSFIYPGGEMILRAESIGDQYQIEIDGQHVGLGHRGTRDVAKSFRVSMSPGQHEIIFQVRDWQAAGGLVGPVYFTTDLNQRIF